MADAFGLAASVAGLISLGLQVTGGIASYLDALESRHEELASVKRQNDALTASLDLIKAASSRAQTHHGHAITTSIQLCEAELRAAEVLLAALANLQLVAQRLHNANQVLQLTVNGLTLEMAGSGVEKLTMIESGSPAIIPLLGICDRVVTTDQLQENSRVTQGMFERSHDSLQLTLRFQSEKIERMEKLLENLQPPGVLTSQSVGTMAHKVAGKPAALKELCDTICDVPEKQPYQPPRSVPFPDQGRRMTSATERICICPLSPRSHRLTTHRTVQLGHFHLSEEQETRGHWPSCPLSRIQPTRKNHRTVGFKYAGLGRILSSIVGASFTFTSGAGSFSIGANLTYYPTVDVKSDPSFCIMRLIEDFPYHAKVNETGALFMNACIKRLDRLFNEKKAYSTAVSDRNKSLMHLATKTVGSLNDYGDSPFGRGFPQLIETLLQYGVPAISYDEQGSSPLLQFYTKEPTELIKEVIKLLVLANQEGDSAALKPSAVYFTGNVIHNDINEVARILDRFPGSLLETDVYMQSPLHLAAAKPEILSLLAQVADIDTLEEVNITGTSALEVAMIRSGDRCIHGTGNKRCRRCGCTECVEILLKAGCCVRMHALDEYDAGLNLQEVMEPASELARRLYVYEMQEVRRRYLLHTDHSDSDSENSTIDGSSCSSSNDSTHGNNDEAEEQWGWVYQEICDIPKAELFYRYGFRPDPSIFFNLRLRLKRSRYGYDVSMTYICWLMEHGADLFSKPSTGPPPCDNDAESGLFGAHYAFFIAGGRIRNLTHTTDDTELDELLAFNKPSTTVVCHNLIDSCICHCSTGGCSPFLWMMKALVPQSWRWAEEHYPVIIKDQMEFYYSTCGTELTVLTHGAAIRYATFQALGLAHTCCNPETLVDGISSPHLIGSPWVDPDDVAIVNVEQASLLKLHEALVAEFTEMAHEYLKADSFPKFWGKSWLGRIQGELYKLNGCNLRDAERRGAEDIGVRWCEPPITEETKARNPYSRWSPEWYFFELDLICPD
ncbi:hypothetical protein PG997_015385 [Apiospora hydei]|uniref:Fungal N-terminal domain-containing protein n=1 Tax=Apiospora hydei TaxID=1337664 RepID=A0ABR1UQG2_9PEZI